MIRFMNHTVSKEIYHFFRGNNTLFALTSVIHFLYEHTANTEPFFSSISLVCVIAAVVD